MKRIVSLALVLTACSGASNASDAGPRDDVYVTQAPDTGPRGSGEPPPDSFWGDRTTIPPATNVMTFQFLNRTNGVLDDAHVFWRFENDTIHELHSLAEASSYDMPANNSGRMYFYLCPSDQPASCVTDPEHSPYYDFIEHTIDTDRYNGNTTRVDAFGIKIAMLLHCHDGFERVVGEDYATFQEDRAATFQHFLDEVPDEFDRLAMPPHAPYRIVQPGADGFDPGDPYASYYDEYARAIWTANGLTIPMPGPNGSGLGAYPNVSAALMRHVGAVAGSFTPDGQLMNHTLWDDPTTFYTEAPADYYARFWHDHGIDGRAYGFPYDDVGSYSSYVSHDNPEYLIIAIGW